MFPGLRSDGQVSSSVSGNRNRLAMVVAKDADTSWWQPVLEPLPSGTRCDNYGTAGFGVLQAEQPHSFTRRRQVRISECENRQPRSVRRV